MQFRGLCREVSRDAGLRQEGAANQPCTIPHVLFKEIKSQLIIMAHLKFHLYINR